MTYTRHGHHIPGTTKDDENGLVPRARCGGPAICSDCQKDVGQHYKDVGEIDDQYDDAVDVSEDSEKAILRAKLFAIGSYNNRANEDDVLAARDLKLLQFDLNKGDWKALFTTKADTYGVYFEVSHEAAILTTTVRTYMLLAVDTFSQEGDEVDGG